MDENVDSDVARWAAATLATMLIVVESEHRGPGMELGEVRQALNEMVVRAPESVAQDATGMLMLASLEGEFNPDSTGF